jgi:hypothetical protein
LPHSEDFDATGEDLYEFTTYFDPYKIIVWVTSGGESYSIDISEPGRALHVGWLALYEHYVSDSLVPDGYYLTEPHFIYSTKAYMHVANDWSGGGVDGVRWQLGAGVSAHFKVVFFS